MKFPFLDTHCHLDMLSNPEKQILKAKARGVRKIIVPAIEPSNFETVKNLAHKFEGIYYSVGIHPCRVNNTGNDGLLLLQNFLTNNINDPKLIAVGEIGLDFFLKERDTLKMEHFFCKQLFIAKNFHLPVLLHIRKSQDLVLKYFKKSGVAAGIAHAFNGSQEQANNFVKNGILLGFGGAMTFTRALKIRHLACSTPDDSFVLETDSPDMSPSWKQKNEENSPEEIPQIAAYLANLRKQSTKKIAQLNYMNATRILPKLLNDDR